MGYVFHSSIAQSFLRWETEKPDIFEQFFQSYVRQYLVTYTLDMFENTEVIVDELSQVYYDADRNPSIDLLMRKNQSAFHLLDEDEAEEEEEDEDYEDYEEEEEDEDDYREIEPWEHPSHPTK